jgi:hypothetical protein
MAGFTVYNDLLSRLRIRGRMISGGRVYDLVEDEDRAVSSDPRSRLMHWEPRGGAPDPGDLSAKHPDAIDVDAAPPAPRYIGVDLGTQDRSALVLVDDGKIVAVLDRPAKR